MNEQMPNFEWSDADRKKIHKGATVTRYWELGVTVETIHLGGVFCPNGETPKLCIGPEKYAALKHCDPKSIR